MIDSIEEELNFWQLLKEDFITHNRDWTSCGFRAMVVYRFGGWAGNIRFRFLRKSMLFIYMIFYRWIRNYYGIELPWSAKLGRRVRIAHQSGIVIHNDAIIGDDCLIRQNVTIGLASAEDGRAPVLGKCVNIGAGAVLFGGVKVGDGARIGPNAVVMQNIPPGATAFGNPVRIFLAAKHERTSPSSGASSVKLNN